MLSLVLGFCAFLGAALLPFAGQLVLLCGYGGRRVLRAGTRTERGEALPSARASAPASAGRERAHAG